MSTIEKKRQAQDANWQYMNQLGIRELTPEAISPAQREQYEAMSRELTSDPAGYKARFTVIKLWSK